MRKRTAVLGLLVALIGTMLLVSPFGGVARAAPNAASISLDDVPIVDDFNRGVEENPLSDEGAWVTWGNGTPLKVTSNELACTTATGNCQSWRKDVRYGIDQEAAVTIKTKPQNGGWVRLYARMQFPTFADGYAVYFGAQPGTDVVGIEIVTGGVHTRLKPFVNQEFQPGDKLRIVVVGVAIQVLRYDSGAGHWTALDQAVDTSYRGVGHVGVGIRYAVARLDDFGARTLREAPADPNPRPLVDDFNRDEGGAALSDGGRWTNWGAGAGATPFKVVSGELACTSTSGGCQAWRNDVRYGLDQEAWVTFATKPNSSLRLWVRMQHPSFVDGYGLYFEPRAGTDRVKFERITNGVDTCCFVALPEGSPDWFPAEFMHGDRLKVRAIGSRLEAWRYDNYLGEWSMLGAVNDSTYLGVGHVGISVRFSVARLDDFGAATLRAPTTNTDPVLDNFNRDDERPLSDDGRWTNWGPGAGATPFKVAAHQLACTSTSGGCDASRTARFGVDQEAWVTFATKPTSSVRLYVRLQQPSVITGYALYYEPREGLDRVKFERVVHGASPVVLRESPTSSEWVPVEFMHGDRLKIRAVGSTLEAWRFDNYMAYWTKLGEVSDSTHVRDGHIGVSVRLTVARLDDFGGGQTDASYESQVLLDRYAPELRFTDDENYRADSAAIATDLYWPDPNDEHTNFLDRPGAGHIAAADPNPVTPLADLSLGHLNVSAQSGDFLNQPKFYFGDAILSARVDYLQWVSEHPSYKDRAYSRLVVDSMGRKFLQYWFFYYYNPKQWGPDLFGLPGKHEGDWEWVQIQLDASDAPVGVAVSQHGDGEQCDYETLVEKAGERPVVYVAHESHANYFWSGDHEVQWNTFRDTDITRDDGPEYRQVPEIANVSIDPPNWIANWDGRWGASGESPQTPGSQLAWDDPWAWQDQQARACTDRPYPANASRQATAGSAQHVGPSTYVAAADERPPLPKIRSARIVSSSRGKAVKIDYCYSSLPGNRGRRPRRLHITVENLRDELPPLSHGWKVTTRCGRIVHPVGPIKPPYLVRYESESLRGTRSREGTLRLS